MPETLGHPMLDEYDAEADRLRHRVDDILERAREDGRDLTDDDETALNAANERLEVLARRADLVRTTIDAGNETASKLVRVQSLYEPERSQAPIYRSVGSAVWDAIHADDDDDAAARYRTALKRAAQHMGTLAADTVATAGDLGGVQIVPKVGPVINPYPARMPLATALGLNPATAGAFERPYIVDANFPDGVDEQTLQKSELASEAFTADTDPVKLTTYGGYLNVSQQLLRWTPGALDIIIGQLNRRRSAKIEAALLTELTASTGKITLALDADFATTWQAIVDGVAAVGKATDEAPTIIAMGWDGYARLAGFTDAAGRPLFPFLGPSNAPGSVDLSSGSMSAVGGLIPVVTPGITDATFWILNGACIEGYVYYYGVLEAVEPSVLGRQVAVAADFNAVRPTPYANAAQHLAP